MNRRDMYLPPCRDQPNSESWSPEDCTDAAVAQGVTPDALLGGADAGMPVAWRVGARGRGWGDVRVADGYRGSARQRTSPSATKAPSAARASATSGTSMSRKTGSQPSA